MVSSFFTKLLSVDKINKVIEVCNKLKINPNWLLAVMYFETARTFSTTKKNLIGSVGLIQFTRDKSGVNYKTIAGKKYLLSDIEKMSFNQQMDLVYLYYKSVLNGKQIKSFIDTYLVTFFPVAIGKSNSFVLSTSNLSASLIAKQNPIFDKNKDSQVTKSEIIGFYDSYYKKLGLDFKKEIDQKNTFLASLMDKKTIIGLLVFFYSFVAILI